MLIILSSGLSLELSDKGKFCCHFQDFREKFWSKFWISLDVLYIETSPSAHNREKWTNLGRLSLPNHSLGWALYHFSSILFLEVYFWVIIFTFWLVLCSNCLENFFWSISLLFILPGKWLRIRRKTISVWEMPTPRRRIRLLWKTLLDLPHLLSLGQTKTWSGGLGLDPVPPEHRVRPVQIQNLLALSVDF